MPDLGIQNWIGYTFFLEVPTAGAAGLELSKVPFSIFGIHMEVLSERGCGVAGVRGEATAARANKTKKRT